MNTPEPTAWFVHGMLEDERSWAPLQRALPRFRAAAPRLPWSALGDPYWCLDRPSVDWLRALDDTTRPPPDLVVGHSFGCNTLLEYLCEHPARQPRLLVLVSPFWRPRRDAIDWPLLRGMVQDIDGLIQESIALSDPSGRYAGSRGLAVARRLQDRLGVYGWTEFLKAFLRSPDLPIQRLRCRTLVVGGHHDSHVPVLSLEQLARALPAASLLLEDGGHFAQITHAAAMARQIDHLLPAPAQTPAESEALINP